jgi:uncharacterized membrane protein
MKDYEPDDDICIHIFTVSAGMVGVCLTVIGLFRLITALKNINTLADDLLVLDAIAFLTSCVLSYLALRNRGRTRRNRLERAAEISFLNAVALMVLICALITYAIIWHRVRRIKH